MKKLVPVILVAVFVSGCAAIAQKATEKTGVSVSAGVESISIETEEGSTGPVSLSPGESVKLIVKGYDANSREVSGANVSGDSVNPTWSSDAGSFSSEEGKETTFTLSEDFSGMMGFVTATQDDMESQITIEIEKE